MAATIQIIKDSSRETVVKLTNDGTAETAVLKVDASTLSGADALATYHELMITNVTWCVGEGYTATLVWDGNTSNSNIVVLSHAGSLRYTGGEYVLLKNDSVGPIGDILMTTAGAGGAPTYTVIITMAKGVGFNRLEATA